MTIEDYYSTIKPEDIWIFPKISSTVQRKYYDKESLIHPAKMPVYLAQKIISEYSKPGDLILDNMAGIGTTLVEAILLGRNAIGVEYEEKFVKIIERNLKSVEAFRSRVPNMGHAIVLKGDSRQLTKVLGDNSGKIDSIAFSPPYANISLKTGVDLKGRIYGRICGDKREFTQQDYKHTLLKEAIDEEKGLAYSKDPANIGNLPAGNIDAIITSPPFANEGINKKGEGTSAYRQTGFAKCASYSLDNAAFGKYGEIDAIVSSPPFENIEPAQDKNFNLKGGLSPAMKGCYSDNKSDHSNLPNLSGETYLSAMLLVYRECFCVLKKNGLMILITKNFVRAGKMIRLDLDTIKLCEAAGFEFKERKYRRLESVSFWIRNMNKKFYLKHPTQITGAPAAEFEDVLVFVKKNKEASST